MDTLQNAPTSNKLINYRPIAEIAVGLMLGIAVCGIMPAGGAAVLCIMTACGAAGVVFALLRHTRSALFAASVLVGILFAALRLPTELPNGNCTVSGIVLSAEYSDGETELILTKSELHSSASAGIFRREGRVKIITEGYLNIDVGDGVYIPKVYLRGAAKTDSSERSRFLKQLSEGITASGRLYGGGSSDDGSTSVDEISVVSKHNLPVREALTSVRSSIVRHMAAFSARMPALFPHSSWETKRHCNPTEPRHTEQRARLIFWRFPDFTQASLPQFSAFLFRSASGGCALHSSESGSSCIAALRYMQPASSAPQ